MDQILNETIVSYNEYINKLPKGCLKIAEMLREGQVVGALNIIRDFSEGVIWVVDANKLFIQNGLLISLDTEKVQNYLIEINEGLEMEDYNLIADLFEYEITPFFYNQKNIST